MDREEINDKFLLYEKLLDGRERLTESHLKAQDEHLDRIEQLSKTTMDVVDRRMDNVTAHLSKVEGNITKFVSGWIKKIVIGVIVALVAIIGVLTWKLPELIHFIAQLSK